MRHQSLVARVAVAALLLGMSACGGGADVRVEPKATRTTASPAPTPTTPNQPRGADGVTYDVLNWEDYADDPAVLAWKRTNEAIAASLNRGKLLTTARQGVNKGALGRYLPSLREAWEQDWHVKSVGQVSVQSVRTGASASSLVMCLWAPSIGFYDKKNAYVGKPENYWRKQNAKLKLSGGRWIVMSFEYDGTCPGSAPA